MVSHKYLVVKGPLTCSTLRKAAESAATAATAATINGPWENCRRFISQRGFKYSTPRYGYGTWEVMCGVHTGENLSRWTLRDRHPVAGKSAGLQSWRYDSTAYRSIEIQDGFVAVRRCSDRLGCLHAR
ncbi:hypothetical protein GQ607_017710 [Colletotrichum asianum]|uniref:Uncharacterized protein n=1 Tax=Colletotrichum asianum TaxID=702518 RepID=A0A8H3ZDH8_9PEZI|nr:hypothetical protein GQ607_017710 [Colletotrichum asianum]